MPLSAAPTPSDMSIPGQTWKSSWPMPASALPLILLQKSKVASDEIFGQIPKWEAIADSYVLSRVTELAYDFNVR
jgi:hypothetical protein